MKQKNVPIERVMDMVKYGFISKNEYSSFLFGNIKDEISITQLNRKLDQYPFMEIHI